MGFDPSCRAIALVMSWVLPQPAGATTSPRLIDRRLISVAAIFDPVQHLVRDVREAAVGPAVSIVLIVLSHPKRAAAFPRRVRLAGLKPLQSASASSSWSVFAPLEIVLICASINARSFASMARSRSLLAGPSGIASNNSCSSARPPPHANTLPPLPVKVASATAGRVCRCL